MLKSYSVLASKFRYIFASIICFAALTGMAQDKTRLIGNKPRTGSSNMSHDVVEGAQIGVKINAGHKPVQLLKLDFHVTSRTSDSIPFKVNVYTMDGKVVKDKLVTTEIKGVVKKYDQTENHLISVDLSPYNVIVKGDILIAVEFLKTQPGTNLGFACGLFNGGSYNKNGLTQEWKKIPVMGADFSVLVKKLPKQKS